MEILKGLCHLPDKEARDFGGPCSKGIRSLCQILTDGHYDCSYHFWTAGSCREELLCDIGAAYLLVPTGWFEDLLHAPVERLANIFQVEEHVVRFRSALYWQLDLGEPCQRCGTTIGGVELLAGIKS